jgi:carbon-monoxide dehydrogenase medium subunit
MALVDFAYHRPASLSEACALGQRLQPDAAFLAGGTDLIPDYQRKRETAHHLIALAAIPELHGIAIDGDVLRIGALSTLAEVASSPLVHGWFPLLAEAAHSVGSRQVRSVATIGGNFCRAVPCADTPPAVLVGDGRVRLMGPDGDRTLAADRFFVGARETALRAGEVMVELRLPVQPAHSGASYQRFARRNGSSLAVAAVAVRITLVRGRITGARIALGAVSPTPRLAVDAAALLEGDAPSEVAFARAAAVCAESASPIDDVRGSIAFRRDLVRVLAQRALTEATDRAQRSSP